MPLVKKLRYSSTCRSFHLISPVVLTDQNIASTKVASCARLNPLLHTADGDGVAKDLHATDNALEFAGGP